MIKLNSKRKQVNHQWSWPNSSQRVIICCGLEKLWKVSRIWIKVCMSKNKHCLFRSTHNWGIMHGGWEIKVVKKNTVRLSREAELKCHILCYQCFSLLHISLRCHDMRLDFSFAIYSSLLKPGESQSRVTTIWRVNLLSFF